VAYINLGDAYAKSGHADKAKKAFGTYLELGTTRAQRRPMRASRVGL
jgi:hypothetical protein